MFFVFVSGGVEGLREGLKILDRVELEEGCQIIRES